MKKQQHAEVTMDGAIYGVVTIKEAAIIWKKHPNTVKMAVRLGQVKARQTAEGLWLVEVASLEERWGPAVQPLLF